MEWWPESRLLCLDHHRPSLLEVVRSMRVGASHFEAPVWRGSGGKEHRQPRSTTTIIAQIHDGDCSSNPDPISGGRPASPPPSPTPSPVGVDVVGNGYGILRRHGHHNQGRHHLSPTAPPLCHHAPGWDDEREKIRRVQARSPDAALQIWLIDPGGGGSSSRDQRGGNVRGRWRRLPCADGRAVGGGSRNPPPNPP
ncbi:hypothetical protein E2562_012759 [Oryza meyeriana var. granulata]|uniref:Uncharacterized protein n=1 Tax=Oryza meyeriana var. granulata TaxID=110450 RepID=A0A6G1DGM7_9ORYZ|nr:hypothetical protein E2562_012759 [Oryza meyeriana var. granulata]